MSLIDSIINIIMLFVNVVYKYYHNFVNICLIYCLVNRQIRMFYSDPRFICAEVKPSVLLNRVGNGQAAGDMIAG